MDTSIPGSLYLVARSLHPAPSAMAPGMDSSQPLHAQRQRLERLSRMPPGSLFAALRRRIALALTPAERFARLLGLEHEGTEAEMQGRTRRADFFWRERNAALRAVWNDAAAWDAGADRESMRAAGAEGMQAYRRSLAELFVDIHVAFYNARAAEPGSLRWNDRAFDHIAHAAMIADLAAYDPDALKRLLVPPGELQISLCHAAGQLDAALGHCRSLAGRFPDLPLFGERLAALHFDGAVRALSDGTQPWMARDDVKRIERALAGLRRDIARFPHNADLYATAARLECVHAVKLANAEQPSAALVALKWAHAYAPGQAGTAELEARVVSNMLALQAGVADLRKQLAASVNAELNERGKALAAEAERGFRPAVEAEASAALAEARRGGEAARQAAAAAVPDTRTWNAGGDDAPLLAVRPDAPKFDREPLGWWLPSRQDLVAKAAALAGAGLLAYAGFAAYQQAEHNAVRARAYAVLVDAAVRGQDDAVMRAAETFLAAPVLGHDGRTADVLRRYEAAFARWFVARGYVLDGPARETVARFRRLAPAAASGTGEVAP